MAVQEQTRTTITPIPTGPTGPDEVIPSTPPAGRAPGAPTRTTTPRRRVALIAGAAVAVVLAAAGIGQLADSGSSADPAVTGRLGFSVIGGEVNQVPAVARQDLSPTFSLFGGEYSQVPAVARLQGLADYREARASEQ
jgi:hypothetical protein